MPLIQAAYSVHCRGAASTAQPVVSSSHPCVSVKPSCCRLPALATENNMCDACCNSNLASRKANPQPFSLSNRSLFTTTVAAGSRYGALSPGDGDTPFQQPKGDDSGNQLLTKEDLYNFMYMTRLEGKKIVGEQNVTLSPDEEEELRSFVLNLDENQWQAAVTPSARVQVKAGPGAGKTRVVLARIMVLLACGVKPEEIVVVAFTSTAAKELMERCSKLVGSSVAAALRPSTIHQLCRDLLREHGHLLPEQLNLNVDFEKSFRNTGRRPSFTASNLERKQLIQDIMFKKGLLVDPKGSTDKSQVGRASGEERSKYWSQAKVYYNAISKVKNSQEHIQGLFGEKLLELQHYVKRRNDPTAQQLADMYDAYEANMASMGKIDYDDELHYCLSLFRKFKEEGEEEDDDEEENQVKAIIHQKWKHILVDESQDLNKCQHALFREFTGPNTSLYMVGDTDQSIYAFRGAAAADWQETYNLLGRNEQKVQLIKDYRSLPGVVFAADELRSLSREVCGGEEVTKRQSVRQVPSDQYISDFQVKFMSCPTATEEIIQIIETIDKWKAAGYQWRDMALLTHSVKYEGDPDSNIASLVRVLENCGIPVYKVQSKEDREEELWLQEDEEDNDEQQADSSEVQQGNKQQPQPAKADEATADAIQLMTLHLAKGKEFPCVAMVFTNELYYYKNDMKMIQLLSEKEEKGKQQTLDVKASRILDDIRQKYNQIYVGMSRAMNHLFISWYERKEYNEDGSLKKGQKAGAGAPYIVCPTQKLAQRLKQSEKRKEIVLEKHGIVIPNVELDSES